MPGPGCIIMVILIIIGYNSHKVKEISFSSFLKKKLAASPENLLLGKIERSLDIILSFYYKTSLHQYTIWEKHLYIFLPRQTQTEEEEIDSQSGRIVLTCQNFWQYSGTWICLLFTRKKDYIFGFVDSTLKWDCFGRRYRKDQVINCSKVSRIT